MTLLRPAQETDLEAIHALSLTSGVGITTLPKDIKLLAKRLRLSCHSFTKRFKKPGNEYYLFVLEDKEGNLIGTSAIQALAGHPQPFYSYHIAKHVSVSRGLAIHNAYETLTLVTDNRHKSELCTLFLDPRYRGSYHGQLISKGRFLFMADFPSRFAASVIAEMRGVSDENGISPFWECVGKPFYHMSFADADRLVLATNKQFIADLNPTHPLYVNLLPKAAQEVIGKSHDLTYPAVVMLTEEGFHPTPYIDIFDAGPTLEAPFRSIKTIASSRVLTIAAIEDKQPGAQFLLSNMQLDFRATIGHVSFSEDGLSCRICHQSARSLKLNVGDNVRLVPLQAKSHPSHVEKPHE